MAYFLGSIWTTVAVSVERYLVVCQSNKSSKFPIYFIPILAFAMLFNIPRFFEYELKHKIIQMVR